MTTILMQQYQNSILQKAMRRNVNEKGTKCLLLSLQELWNCRSANKSVAIRFTRLDCEADLSACLTEVNQQGGTPAKAGAQPSMILGHQVMIRPTRHFH